jgi:flagella basal body P-ring formation protein FlgA
VVVRRFDAASQALVEETRVLADVQQQYLAVVAQRRITRGSTIGHDDVALEPVFVRGGSLPLTDLEAVIGQAVSGTLRTGDTLTAASVEAPRLVRRGDQLVVRCVVGNLVIRLNGVAMSDGGRGQVIHVRNASSRETFLARVIGAHEAELVRDQPGGDSEAL